MLFVVANNLMVISANALPFNNFSTVTGSIGNGNGYYSDESAFTNISTPRNIYVVAEPTQIVIVEPIGYPQGQSGAITLMVKGDTNFQYASVLSDGYLYFTDSQGLKKRKTRDSNTVHIANTSSEVLTILASASIGKFYEYQGRIYFIDGTTLKYTSAPDYQVTTVWTGITKGQSMAVTNINGVFTLYVSNVFSNTCSANLCATLNVMSSNSTINNSVIYTASSSQVAPGGTLSYAYSTLFLTNTYLYVNAAGHVTYSTFHGYLDTEKVFRLSNYSVASTDYYVSSVKHVSNAIALGGYSTIALYDYSTTVYDTFNFAESGILVEVTQPAQITYTTKTIESTQSTYYNRSNIKLNYNIVIDSDPFGDNGLIATDDYRWMVSMVDPNGVSKDVYQTPKCNLPFLSFTCSVSETLEFAWPDPGWLQGAWTAKLYEINTVTPNRALIATSSVFTVLNTSLENQSVINPPTIPITSGTAPQAINLIDGFVLWMGMGSNSVSKFLFAGIIIAICGTIGFMIKRGNGNVAMVFAFLPYAFFSMIDYIPKWVFIISIILFAIASRVFR